MKTRFVNTPHKPIDRIFDVRLGCWSPNVNYANRGRMQPTLMKTMSPPSLTISSAKRKVFSPQNKASTSTAFETPKHNSSNLGWFKAMMKNNRIKIENTLSNSRMSPENLDFQSINHMSSKDKITSSTFASNSKLSRFHNFKFANHK